MGATRRVAAVATALLALAGGGCHYKVTEVVLRVDTDMSQGPTDDKTMDSVRVVVRSGENGPVRLMQMFDVGDPAHHADFLPSDLGITPRDNDANRVVDITIDPLKNGEPVFPRPYHVIVPFEGDHINLLDVFLADRCRTDTQCTDPDSTCGRYGCESVHRTNLPDLDASAQDGAADAVTDAVTDAGCGAGRTSCGGQCVDTESDPHHCGSCSGECGSLPNINSSSATCLGGMCGFGACLPGFADCNHTAGDGCETTLGTTSNCGGCGMACPGGQVCNGGTCDTGCAANLTNCGGSCVDVTSTASHCGGCSNACPSVANGAAVCMGGRCDFLCNAGYHRCGAGCASDSDPATCGASCTPCPTPPNATASCNGSTCGFTCNTLFANCDGNAANGCEADLRSGANCGSCGNACTGGATCSFVGGAYVCTGGSSCTGGATCAPPGICETGQTACDGGAQYCMPTGPAPAGTPCGGGVCNDAGFCCMTGPCAIGPCLQGTLQCNSTGTTFCDALPANEGMTCAPGSTCQSGTCAAADAGTVDTGLPDVPFDTPEEDTGTPFDAFSPDAGMMRADAGGIATDF